MSNIIPPSAIKTPAPPSHSYVIGIDLAEGTDYTAKGYVKDGKYVITELIRSDPNV